MSKPAAGRYPEAKGGKVAPADWVVERVFDSADYLDRKPPRYAGQSDAASAAGSATKRALSKPAKGKPSNGSAR